VTAVYLVFFEAYRKVYVLAFWRETWKALGMDGS
jgi:hypothetical protein